MWGYWGWLCGVMDVDRPWQAGGEVKNWMVCGQYNI